MLLLLIIAVICWLWIPFSYVLLYIPIDSMMLKAWGIFTLTHHSVYLTKVSLHLYKFTLKLENLTNI